MYRYFFHTIAAFEYICRYITCHSGNFTFGKFRTICKCIQSDNKIRSVCGIFKYDPFQLGAAVKCVVADYLYAAGNRYACDIIVIQKRLSRNDGDGIGNFYISAVSEITEELTVFNICADQSVIAGGYADGKSHQHSHNHYKRR